MLRRFCFAGPTVLALVLHSVASALPPERKPDVPFVPTPKQLADLMLQMAEVKKTDVVYDLGCGDGRLVIVAAKTYGARGVGIEIDPQLVTTAKRNAELANVSQLVEFREADLFQSDFRDATVFALYLFEEVNVRLRPKIFAQVKPGARVVSHGFRMGEWAPDAKRAVTLGEWNYDIFLWIVPANISGRWQATGARRPAGVPDEVAIEQRFQKITVRSMPGGQLLGEGTVRGSDFLITWRNDGAPLSVTGHIDGEHLAATFSGSSSRWAATRQPSTAKPIDPSASTLSAARERLRKNVASAVMKIASPDS